MEMLTVGRLALARQGTSSRLTPADACAHPFALVSTPADSSAANADPSTLVAPSHLCLSFWTAVWPADRRAEISSVWWRRRGTLGRTRPARRKGWKDEARMGCEGERTSAARTGSEADESADASSASRTPRRCAAGPSSPARRRPAQRLRPSDLVCIRTSTRWTTYPTEASACSCGAAVCAVVDRGFQTRRACNAKRQRP
ncbi:hypothetical protein BJ912DRAFT_992646 [Pholiota molesta]|nr:hypothetical protein BJ912DRAFT_992646 [Pholiota molesta]